VFSQEMMSAARDEPAGIRVKGALHAYVKRLRVSSNQNDETRSRNSLMYMSKANLTIAVN